MTAEPKIEHKFEYQWGGEENWYTKSKKWAKKQKFPINHLALGIIESLWVMWVQGKVDMEMSSVDKQVNEIMEKWKEQEPVVEIKASDIEGLDDISIHAPWSSTIGDWNDSAINYKKWR